MSNAGGKQKSLAGAGRPAKRGEVRARGGPSGRGEAHRLGAGLGGSQLCPLLQLQWEVFVASFTHGLHVKFHKLVPGEEVQWSGEPHALSALSQVFLNPQSQSLRSGLPSSPSPQPPHQPAPASGPDPMVSFSPKAPVDREMGLQASLHT